MHAGITLAELDGVRVIKCNACGFSHIDPLPSEAELTAQYKDYPVAPTFLARYHEDLKWWQMHFSRRLVRLATIAGGRGKVIDIGGGLGYFSQTAQTEGWDATSIEPSAARCSHTRTLGCKVIEADLKTAMKNGIGTFDSVHASEVLEHVLDPAAMLTDIRLLLRPGGSACIVVPNDFNPVQRAAITRDGLPPWWVVPQHHINYFTHATLADLALHCKLEVVGQSSTFPIDLFLLMGDQYVGNDKLGRVCHRRRVALDLALGQLEPETLDLLENNWAQAGLGREAIVWLRRPEST